MMERMPAAWASATIESALNRSGLKVWAEAWYASLGIGANACICSLYPQGYRLSVPYAAGLGIKSEVDEQGEFITVPRAEGFRANLCLQGEQHQAGQEE